MLNIFKRQKLRQAQSADRSRRSFIWNMGAGASAALVSTVGGVQAETRTAHDPSLRVGLLEDEQVLRKFHQRLEQAMDQGLHEEVIGMFAADAEVVFNGGVFSQRDQGVTRLYRDRFPSGHSGRRMQPAPGFEPSADQQRDSVDVSPDRRTAKSVFPYSIQVGMPLEAESSLTAMARLHGEGVRTWWEGGVYRIHYRKDVPDGPWTISRLEYDTQSRADYRPARRYATPISVPRLQMRFPEDPQGPDRLV